VPNIAGYDKILVGSTVKQQLENDLGLEQAALEVLKPGIHTCLESRDDASRELLEHIVVDEERHIDWIEAQFHQIKEVGYENYLSQQIFKKARRFTFYCLAPLAACARTLVPGISTTANLGRRLYPTSCPRSLSGWFTAPYFQ
jgi:rubrerythrin